MSCAEHIGLLLAGRVGEWNGIGSGCRIDDLRETFRIDDEWGGRGYLGEEEYDAEYVGIAVEESGNEARLWHDEAGTLLLVEMIEPETFPTVEELLAMLGPPDARLDAVVGLRGGRGNEWVYPGRGFVAYVPSGAGRVERVVGFPPATIDEYRRTLRLNLEQRRLQTR